MDTQLKYRLTGAAILVVLAVLLVPELLTGPKRAVNAPAAPSAAAGPAAAEGPPVRSYDIDLTDSAARPATANDESAAATAATPAAPMAVPMGAPAAGAPPAAAPPPPSTPAAAPRSTAGSAAPQAPAARPSGRGGAFAVQLGSFASRDTAERLAAELRARRYEVYVSPVTSSGRTLHRVRVGPVTDRAAAETLKTRLETIGRKGAVVTEP